MIKITIENTTTGMTIEREYEIVEDKEKEINEMIELVSPKKEDDIPF